MLKLAIMPKQILALKILPTEKIKKVVKIDWSGAILFAMSIVPLFYVLTNWKSTAVNNIEMVLLILLALCSFIIFIIVEKRNREPLLHLELFKNRLFSISILSAFISFVSIFCAIIIMPFYLQDVKGLTPAGAGVIMMAYPIILAFTAPMSGYISDKIGSEIITFIGLTITSAGLFIMASLTETSTTTALILSIAVMSFGNGMFQSPNNSLVMSQAPKNKLGIAGSINSLIRNLGMVFGVSFSTTFLYDRMSYKIGYKVTNYVANRSDIFIYGMKVVFITAGFLSLFGALLTALRMIEAEKKIEV